MPTLFVLSGPEIGRSFELDGEVVVGRSPENAVPLAAPSISRRHARIAHEATGWVVHDLDSRNGLFSGELRVQRLELTDGDVFRLGDVELRFRLAGAAAAKAPQVSAPSPTPKLEPEAPPAPRASTPPPLDLDEIVLEDDPSEFSAPVASPPPPPPRPAPAPASPPSAPTRTGGSARRPAAPTGADVRQRESRPALQFNRVEDRGGFLTSDLGQYPLWLRLGALVLALALFVGIFLFAFRGTALLKGRISSDAATTESELSR